ncbi:MAG: carboxypeptidase-like regulatory domain-containing protein, partial [Terriglobales bacterium]
MRQPIEMRYPMQEDQKAFMASKFCCCLLGFVTVILLAALAPAPAAAQNFTGFFGTVKDQSGAVVPGTTIQIKEEKTGFTASTTTNDTGQFVFQGIPTGTYTIEAEQKGFSKYTNTEVIVYARVPRRVDVTL